MILAEKKAATRVELTNARKVSIIIVVVLIFF